ncbi:signal peptide peptidase-domain-containing protein [Russula dissimulans]|nr:signal peptide peptidase-domain-containing protein [Russula dissimulans]
MSDGLNVDLLFAYVGLITTATTSIYAGSFGSLPKSKSKSHAKHLDLADLEDEDESGRVTAKDAWLFPLLGSALLVGLFLIIKYLGKEWLNWLMSFYFALTGLYSVPRSLISLVAFTLGTKRWNQFTTHRVKVRSRTFQALSFSCRTPSIFLTALGAIPSVLYAFWYGPTKPILLTNILALSFGHEGMSTLKVDSFKTGSILLSGLFLYDIWWVFGTKVMVSVATSLDLPMKILWPKSAGFSMENGTMMLGLGDIVVPGTFISLALRYDYFRYAKAKPAGPFTKPYFVASLVAYVAGLAITMTVMHLFHAAQPALLYLSPACILSFIFTAWRRGELIEAWRWNEGTKRASQNGSAMDNSASDSAAGGGTTSDPSEAVHS